MITGYIVGDRELIAKLRNAPEAIQDRVAKTVDDLGVRLARNVVMDYLSGQVLKRVTGRLASSITRGGPDSRSRFEETGTSATSYVGTNVSYGKTWEYGAHIPAYTVYPKNAKALHFFMGGQEIFAKHANIPARDVGARPFLVPALDAFKPTIIAEIQKAAREGVQAALK